MQDDEVGEGGEVHRTTGGTGGGGRLNIGKETVDAFLEGTAIRVWDGVVKGDVPGESVGWDWQDSHSDSESPSSEGAALESEASSVKVGVSPKGL